MEFIILLFLLIINGLFAMYEIALVSSSSTRLLTLANKGSKSAVSVLKQLKEPEKILSTIQIGITLIGIVSGVFGGVAIADDLTPILKTIPVIAIYADNLSLILVVTCITYLSLVIGELVPKSIGLSNPEKIAIALNPFIQIIRYISLPFVFILSQSTTAINRVLNIKSNEHFMTQEELKLILHQSAEQGVIDKDENEMLKDVFKFSNKRANELMTHRKEIAFLYPNYTKKEVLDIINNKHFSKYLLTDIQQEKIIGVVSVKDVILMIGSDNLFNLSSIAHPPLYIPESLYAKKVLELFKKNKNKFGVVVNEYGGIEGIITLHDLTESIFGDILEENDIDECSITKREDGSYLVDASMNIVDFMDDMGIIYYNDLENENFKTLGGMAMFFIERIPITGDRYTYQNLQFEIVDMDNGRVDKLLVTPITQ